MEASGEKHDAEKNPIMTKLHYQIQLQAGLTKEFRKSVYKVHSKPDDHMVVQYLVNSAVAEDFPHGNSKTGKFLAICKVITGA